MASLPAGGGEGHEAGEVDGIEGPRLDGDEEGHGASLSLELGEDSGVGGLGDALEALDGQLGDGVTDALDGEVVTAPSPLCLQEEATHALEAYRDAGDCVLLGAGYLGITGSSWGCVVQGDGWVEVRIVSQGEGDAESRVTVVHMDILEWQKALLGLGEAGE